MKAQNCPLCGSKAEFIIETGTVFCTKLHCQFGDGFHLRIEMWNRIRIAPDDKAVKDWPDEVDGGYKCFKERWMDPNF